jgi:hypothetical protein
MAPIPQIPPALLNPHDLDLSIGQVLRIVTYLHGYTSKELALGINYSKAHVNNVMGEQEAATVEFLGAVAKFLNVVPHRLDKFAPRHFDRRKQEWRERADSPPVTADP